MRLDKTACRQIAIQGLVIAAVAAATLWVGGNVAANLGRAGIEFNFRFLSLPATFELGESFLSFRSGESIGRAFLAGLSNTIVVSALSIVFATVLGVLIGVARLSTDKFLTCLAFGYVEGIRSTSLLLQLLFWHTLFTHALPAPRQAGRVLDCAVFSNRGIFLPFLTPWGWSLVAGGATVLFVTVGGVWRYAPGRQRMPGLALSVGLVPVLAIAIGLASHDPAVLCPRLQGFNIAGGTNVSTEFAALLLALSLYASSYISEVVRSSIAAVPRSQVEAGRALGLRSGPILWLVVMPQALKTMIPPMTNQYLNVMKSSSLAVAIGYPDVVRVSMITISQTGRAIECMMIITLVYLSISLLIALAMNIYNRRRLQRSSD
jgi:general L-amino acid transport system permease protein